jgi:hypothetical protein
VENQSSPSGLTGIVTSVATKLRGVTASTAADVSTGILAELVAILDVQRLDKPDPDPLHTVYFTYGLLRRR